MHASRPPTLYTDTWQIAWMFLPASLIMIALGIPAVKEGKIGLAIFFFLLGAWSCLVAICQFIKNGKQVTLAIGDEGVTFGDGSALAFRDVEKITVMDQFPQLPVQCVSIIFYLRPDMQVRQGGRSLRRRLMLSEVYGNTSLIGKHKMLCYASPGLRIQNGPMRNDEEVGKELFGRFQAFQERAHG